MRPGELEAHVEHFRARVLQDALAEATRDYWCRRADQLEAAMPRAGDYLGRATPGQIKERRQQLEATVLACRQRARVSLIGGELA